MKNNSFYSCYYCGGKISGKAHYSITDYENNIYDKKICPDCYVLHIIGGVRNTEDKK